MTASAVTPGRGDPADVAEDQRGQHQRARARRCRACARRAASPRRARRRPRAGPAELIAAGSSISASVRLWSSEPRSTFRWIGPSWLSRCSEPSGGMSISVPPAERRADRHLGAERPDVEAGVREQHRADDHATEADQRRPRRRSRPGGSSGDAAPNTVARERAAGRTAVVRTAQRASSRRRHGKPMCRRLGHHRLTCRFGDHGNSAPAGAAVGEDEPDDAVVVGGRVAAVLLVRGADPQRAVRGGDQARSRPYSPVSRACGLPSTVPLPVTSASQIRLPSRQAVRHVLLQRRHPGAGRVGGRPADQRVGELGGRCSGRRPWASRSPCP